MPPPGSAAPDGSNPEVVPPRSRNGTVVLLPSGISTLNDALTVCCILFGFAAMSTSHLTEPLPPLPWEPLKSVSKLVCVMCFTCAMFEFVFIIVRRISITASRGFDTSYQGSKLVRDEYSIFLLFVFVSVAYGFLSTESNYAYGNAMAQAAGQDRPVYSARYHEWTFATPVLISVATPFETPSFLGGRFLRLPSTPSGRLTGAYCFVSYIASRVKNPWVHWPLTALVFFGYITASVEQVSHARLAWAMTQASRTKAALLVFIVVSFGIYGIVWLLAIPNFVSPEVEQMFYSVADLSAKMCAGLALVVCTWQEHIEILQALHTSAVATATDMKVMLATASAPVFGVDTAGNVNEWNDKMHQLVGIPVEKAMGKSLLELFGDQIMTSVSQVGKAIETNQPVCIEIDMVLKGDPGKAKRHIMLVVSVTPRSDSTGTIVGAICMGQDLTEVAAVKEAEARKTRFLAVVSHELRSPLHGIIGLTDGLREREADSTNLKHLTMVKNCASRLLDLVASIMDITSLTQSGDTGVAQYKMARDPVEVPKVVEEVVLLVRSAVDKQGNLMLRKEVKLINGVGNNLPIIEGDAHKCTQLIYNLVTNACKFTHAGFIVITSDVDATGDHVEISVADTGRGIAEDSLHRIFRPFEQEEMTEERSFEGIGLGLSICKEIVDRHGGTFRVESEVKKGSIFTIRLPVDLKEGEKAQATSIQVSSTLSILPTSLAKEFDEPRFIKDGTKSLPVAVPQRPKNLPSATNSVKSLGSMPQTMNSLPPFAMEPRRPLHVGKPMILSVDDEFVNQAVIRSALESEYDVVCVMNGAECQKFLKDKEQPLPELVLLDIMMPGMSGFEVAEWVRKEFKMERTKLPIIMLSARSPVSASLVKGMECGCNDYVQKPFETEVLRARLATSLQLKRLCDQATAGHKNTPCLSSGALTACDEEETGQLRAELVELTHDMEQLQTTLKSERAEARRQAENSFAELTALNKAELHKARAGATELEAIHARLSEEEKTAACLAQRRGDECKMHQDAATQEQVVCAQLRAELASEHAAATAAAAAAAEAAMSSQAELRELSRRESIAAEAASATHALLCKETFDRGTMVDDTLTAHAGAAPSTPSTEGREGGWYLPAYSPSRISGENITGRLVMELQKKDSEMQHLRLDLQHWRDRCTASMRQLEKQTTAYEEADYKLRHALLRLDTARGCVTPRSF